MRSKGYQAIVSASLFIFSFVLYFNSSAQLKVTDVADKVLALNPDLQKLYPFCRLTGAANVLIMPGLHSAAIATQLLEELAGEVFIGPILNGFEYPVQIIPMGSSANDILEVAAFAIMDSINNSKL